MPGLSVVLHDASSVMSFPPKEEGKAWPLTLRVLNATHDLTYVEYDPTWTFAPPLQHRELYDNAADPYQLASLAASADPGALAALHAELEAYWRCKGAACP